MELVLRNQSALLFVSTKDMAALPNRWETRWGISLKEGRWLDLTDYEEARPVCVIHANFALLRGLVVGDTITVDMQDHYYGELINSKFTLYRGYDGEVYNWNPGTLRKQYIPYVRELERYDWQQPHVQHKIELEIVGTYSMPDAYNSRERNLVYIPDSVMPADFGGDSQTTTEQAMFSYALGSYKDVNVFIQENRDILADMGLRIVFLDNNAEGFWEIVKPLQEAKMIVIIACAVLLILILMLSVYLYLHQRRKEFAIMRALGTPLKIVRSQLLLPMSMIGGAGIAIGGYMAWQYAMQQIGQVMAPLTRWQVEIPNFEPPSTILLVVICAAVFLLLQLILHIGTAKMSKRSVLEVLQGGAAALQQYRTNEHAGPAVLDTVLNRNTAEESGKVQSPATQMPGGYKSPASIKASLWYVINNIIRAPLKPALTAAVAIAFVLALGYMNLLIERNDTEIERLYSNTNVEAEIMVDSMVATMASTIPKELTDALRDSGYVIGTNVQHARWWAISTDKEMVVTRLHAIDNPNALTGAWRNTIIEYAEGWDESLFAMEFVGSQTSLVDLNSSPFDVSSSNNALTEDIQAQLELILRDKTVPIAVSSDIQAQLDLKLGDKVTFWSPGGVDNGIMVAVYSFDTVVAAVFAKNSTAAINSGVGEENDNTVLLPYSMTELIPSWTAIESVSRLLESKNRFTAATFLIDPSRNRELALSTAELDRIVRTNMLGLVPMSLRLWDEELRQVIEPMEYTLSLLGVLYPIILMASIMIAAGLALLMVMQSIKLVAILRVLGTTKARVIAMQGTEQVILCLAGLALGILAAVIFLGTTIALSSSSFAQAGLYLSGAFLGAMFAARMATNRSPMDLLQVRE